MKRKIATARQLYPVNDIFSLLNEPQVLMHGLESKLAKHVAT